jgi:Uma2 family endonuclease
VLLIVEVSDSSLDYDRSVKGRVYAKAGIVEYWIADITHDYLLVHSDPREGAYGSVRQFNRGESLSPQLLSGCSLRVSDLLP